MSENKVVAKLSVEISKTLETDKLELHEKGIELFVSKELLLGITREISGKDVVETVVIVFDTESVHPFEDVIVSDTV